MIVRLLTMLASGFGVLGFATTAGAIANAAASYQDYTAGGGTQTAVLSASQSGAILIAKATNRLQKVLITTSAAVSITFYDTTSTSSQAGATIIGYVPASAAAGTIYSLQMPTQKGIVAVISGGGGVAATVSFN